MVSESTSQESRDRNDEQPTLAGPELDAAVGEIFEEDFEVPGTEAPGQETPSIEVTTSDTTVPVGIVPEDVLASWRQEFTDVLEGDMGDLAKLQVSLDQTHPGGLAQLYVDHPTKLSTLIREPNALQAAEKDIARLRSATEALKASYGQAEAHLAIGFGSWAGSGELPLLMRQVRFGEDDLGNTTIQLLPGVQVSAPLLNAAAAAGHPIDMDSLAATLGGTSGFLPASALDVLRDGGQALPGFKLTETLQLGVFAHPAASLYSRLVGLTQPQLSKVVRALGGDDLARGSLTLGQVASDLTDRDPWSELGLGDQTPQTQQLVETVASGASVAVDVVDLSRPQEFVASVAAALVAKRRQVAVVVNEPAVHERLMDAFETFGIQPIVADLSAFSVQEGLTESLQTDLASLAPPPADAELDAKRVRLERVRAALEAHTEALHEKFEPWGVSAYDALQVLTDLTSLPDAPQTSLRFPVPTLSRLAADGGEKGAQLLEQASALGLFDPQEPQDAWSGVVIEDPADIGDMLGALGRIDQTFLPTVRMNMVSAAARSELKGASTLGQWRDQLGLLKRVQGVLDTFEPQVLDRSPADLVVATASKQWRKSRNINLKKAQRRTLVRQARDMVRPGVHVEDLNEALINAQGVRHQWSKARLNSNSVPTVPTDLDEMQANLVELFANLDEVRPFLEPVYGDLDSLPVDELAGIISTLYETPDGAAKIPGLLGVLDELDAMGLHDLVLDLRERGIDGESLSLELDLAWWASALGHMLAEDERLGGFEPANLGALLGAFQELDEALVDQLGPALVSRVMHWAGEVRDLYPDQAKQFADELSSGAVASEIFATNALAWDYKPIVVLGPAQVPLVAAAGVDTMILDQVAGLTAAELAALSSLGEQVVGIVANAQDPASALILESLPVLTPPLDRALGTHVVSELVNMHAPGAQGVVVPSPRGAQPLAFVLVDGVGMPGSGTQAIETSVAEATAVAQLVQDHLASKPDVPLSVVTFSARHRDHVVALIRKLAEEDSQFADQLDEVGGVESIVVSPEALNARPAGQTIVSVGFAKTPHGRVIHDFGVFSTDQGLAVMDQLARGLRGDVTIVSALSALDVDYSRLHTEGERVLVDLLSAAEQGLSSLPSPEAESEAGPPQLLVDLAERLHQLGLRVVPNFGSDTGIPIPLAIGHPEVPDELLVAVLTDDGAYQAEPSLRVRSRHIPKLLEEAGWKVHTALSMPVFIDPNREAQEIVNLTLDAVDEYYTRLGEPATPAAAAALGLPMVEQEGQEGSQSQADTETNEASESESKRITESDVTGPLPQLSTHSEPVRILEEVPMGERSVAKPPYAAGLPLAAYSDDQLDEMTLWILSDGIERDDDAVIVALREELGITRRGVQTDAVLRAALRRVRGNQ